MCTLFSKMPKTAKICDFCRKEITELRNQNAASCSTYQHQESSPEFDKDSNFTASPEVIKTLNTSLQELRESLIDRKKKQIQILCQQENKEN